MSGGFSVGKIIFTKRYSFGERGQGESWEGVDDGGGQILIADYFIP